MTTSRRHWKDTNAQISAFRQMTLRYLHLCLTELTLSCKSKTEFSLIVSYIPTLVTEYSVSSAKNCKGQPAKENSQTNLVYQHFHRWNFTSKLWSYEATISTEPLKGHVKYIYIIILRSLEILFCSLEIIFRGTAILLRGKAKVFRRNEIFFSREWNTNFEVTK